MFSWSSLLGSADTMFLAEERNLDEYVSLSLSLFLLTRLLVTHTVELSASVEKIVEYIVGARRNQLDIWLVLNELALLLTKGTPVWRAGTFFLCTLVQELTR